MPDHPQSTAVPPRETWESQPAFREYFLTYLPPEHAACCRRLGDVFFTAVLEANMREFTEDPASLLALAADVRSSALVLDGILTDLGGLHGIAGDALRTWRDRLLAVERDMRAAAGSAGEREEAEADQ